METYTDLKLVPTKPKFKLYLVHSKLCLKEILESPILLEFVNDHKILAAETVLLFWYVIDECFKRRYFYFSTFDLHQKIGFRNIQV